jgi:hypothetical protein
MSRERGVGGDKMAVVLHIAEVANANGGYGTI